jgi:hypothetical protein
VNALFRRSLAALAGHEVVLLKGVDFKAGQARDSLISLGTSERVLRSPRVPALVVAGCLRLQSAGLLEFPVPRACQSTPEPNLATSVDDGPSSRLSTRSKSLNGVLIILLASVRGAKQCYEPAPSP